MTKIVLLGLLIITAIGCGGTDTSAKPSVVKTTMKKTIVVLGLLLISVVMLSGCDFITGSVPGVPSIRWSRPGTTQQEFFQDRYQCLKEASRRVSSTQISGAYGGFQGNQSSDVSPNGDMFKACMMSKGYQLNYSGEFGAPPGGGASLQ